MSMLSLVLFLFAATTTPAVEAFKGTATVTSDLANHETNVTYKADTIAAPIYFVLQHEDNVPLPEKWSGPARLFLSDGVLALVADNGKAQLFKFAERGVPSSLRSKFKFDIIPTFGIARYEHKPPAR